MTTRRHSMTDGELRLVGRIASVKGPTRVYHEGRGLTVDEAWREGVLCDRALVRDDGWTLGYMHGDNDQNAFDLWPMDWVGKVDLLTGEVSRL